MPAPSDIFQFLRGQLFQTPTLPNASLAGKTVVVTGGNSGLGFESAKQLAQLEVSILVLGCRNVSKGEAARSKILQEYPSDTTIKVWEVDMSKYESVRSFSQRIRNELPRLDALIANAGMSTNQYNAAETLEETLTVNVVSTFLLSLLCIPTLQKTAAEIKSPTHLSITGSVVHCFADHKQIQQPGPGNVLKVLSDCTQADMSARYFLSKLIVLLCVQEMAMHIPAMPNSTQASVIINCPNPGWCKTGLFRQDDGGAFARNLLKLIGRTGNVGARTLTSAIAAGNETHGRYLSECQVKPASAWVRSEDAQVVQRELWAELLQVIREISPGAGEGLVTDKTSQHDKR